jgi:ribosomal protein S18 acetylase RimI-like enzyme
MGTEASGDALILRAVMCEAVRTSPEAFLKTEAEYTTKLPEYWANELQSAKWAVVERAGEVIGVAASKLPHPRLDREDPATARYIESLWVKPWLRRRRLGERLLKYLLTAEYWDNQHIREFLLWVFPENKSAMRLYEHLGFAQTLERNEEPRPEIKYRLDFIPELHTTIGLVTNLARRHDQLHRGVTYRVLGQPDGL